MCYYRDRSRIFICTFQKICVTVFITHKNAPGPNLVGRISYGQATGRRQLNENAQRIAQRQTAA